MYSLTNILRTTISVCLYEQKGVACEICNYRKEKINDTIIKQTKARNMIMNVTRSDV